MNNINTEKKTVSILIKKYCKKKHKTAKLCNHCEKIHDYSISRIDNCPYNQNKPACNKCTIHCFSNEYRSNIKKIMRFSGPRIIFSNPILGIIHLKKILITTKKGSVSSLEKKV